MRRCRKAWRLGNLREPATNSFLDPEVLGMLQSPFREVDTEKALEFAQHMDAGHDS